MGIYNNYVIQKGATWEATVYWKDSNGNAINLTGYTAKFQVSNSYDGSISTPNGFELTSPSGGITIINSEGRINLIATATTTSSLNAGRYYYELELIIGSTVYRILEGELTVTPQVKS